MDDGASPRDSPRAPARVPSDCPSIPPPTPPGPPPPPAARHPQKRMVTCPRMCHVPPRALPCRPRAPSAPAPARPREHPSQHHRALAKGTSPRGARTYVCAADSPASPPPTTMARAMSRMNECAGAPPPAGPRQGGPAWRVHPQARNPLGTPRPPSLGPETKEGGAAGYPRPLCFRRESESGRRPWSPRGAGGFPWGFPDWVGTPPGTAAGGRGGLGPERRLRVAPGARASAKGARTRRAGSAGGGTTWRSSSA